jgi:hypothetical protein
MNGGTCSIGGDGSDYTCTCPPGYVGDNCEYEEKCCVKGAPTVDKLNYDSGTWLNIFVDFKFDCSGQLVKWEFYAKKAGVVFLAVWRPLPNSDEADQWQLIGKNRIRVWNTGPHEVLIAEEDQIEVQAGDVFGMQYPEFMVTPDDDRGVIPYTDNNIWGPGLCCDITEDQLSRIHNVVIQDEELPIGVVREGLRDFKRAVSLRACLYEKKVQCSLEGGPLILLNYDSGVWVNVFVDFAFDCAGAVTRWRFHAKQIGTVILTVWRPDDDNKGWTLIGKNTVVVTSLDVQDAIIPEGDRIEVEAGDVIGMQYPRDAFGSGPPYDRGIISYTDTRVGGPGLCCGVGEEKLTHIHNGPIPDEELDVGVHVTGLRSFRRAVALHAFINDDY